MTRLPRVLFQREHGSAFRRAASCRSGCRSSRPPLRRRSANPRRPASAASRPATCRVRCSAAASSARSAVGSGGAVCSRRPAVAPTPVRHGVPRCRLPACRATSRILPTRSRSFSQRPFSSRQPALPTASLRLASAARRFAVIGAQRGFALQDARLHRAIVDLRVASSIAGGVAFCPSASRAQAVSSTLTALSGSWRSGR